MFLPPVHIITDGSFTYFLRLHYHYSCCCCSSSSPFFFKKNKDKNKTIANPRNTWRETTETGGEWRNSNQKPLWPGDPQRLARSSLSLLRSKGWSLHLVFMVGRLSPTRSLAQSWSCLFRNRCGSSKLVGTWWYIPSKVPVQCMMEYGTVAARGQRISAYSISLFSKVNYGLQYLLEVVCSYRLWCKGKTKWIYLSRGIRSTFFRTHVMVSCCS